MNVNEVLSKDYLNKMSFEKTKPHKDSLAVKTLRLRLKDKHASYLNQLAMEVNQVWNFCNAHGMKVYERERRFCTAYDMHPYLRGSSKEGLHLHSQTIQAITEEYVTRRSQFNKVKLRWRTSRGSRRSLGWIPFKASAISYKNGQVVFNGKPLSLWDSYGLKDYELGPGAISQDARGRWYINMTVKVNQWVCSNVLAKDVIGIDLGLETLLATSNGQKERPPKFYRTSEDALAKAQRAKKKQRVKAIHAKIANQRKNFLHQLSSALVKQCDAIFVGNVSSSVLTQTSHAKSVLDAGWSTFRTMLRYKCAIAGVWFHEVNEAYTTQTCSDCRAKTGPKGQAELGIKRWVCTQCHVAHDRDINAAKNIKILGLQWLTDLLTTSNERLSYQEALNASGVGHGPLPTSWKASSKNKVGILCL